MELTEPIEVINKRLVDNYGLFEGISPNYQVVFANDQYEKVDGSYEKYNEHGVYLGTETGVHLVPKYTYARDRYILEKLFPTPFGTKLTTKLTYENVWTFQDRRGDYLPPCWEAIVMIIKIINFNLENKYDGTAKYRDPDFDLTPEMQAEKFNKIARELYGNETSIGDSLAVKSGVGFTKTIQ